MTSRQNSTGVYDIPYPAELEDLFRAAARTIKLTIRTNVPATVTSFNPATQKVTVTVDFLQTVKVSDVTRIPSNTVKIEGTPPNARATLQPFILTDIPIRIDGTQRSYTSYPINPGDTGTLHVHDRSLATWLAIGSATDPVLALTHQLADSEFVPGLRPDTKPITPPIDLTATVLHDDVAIKLGRAAALAVARVTDETLADAEMATWMTLVTTVLTTMVTAWTATQPGGGPLVAPAATPLAPPVFPNDFGVIATGSNKVSSE